MLMSVYGSMCQGKIVQFCNWPQAHQSDSHSRHTDKFCVCVCVWVEILFLNLVKLVHQVLNTHRKEGSDHRAQWHFRGEG